MGNLRENDGADESSWCSIALELALVAAVVISDTIPSPTPAEIERAGRLAMDARDYGKQGRVMMEEFQQIYQEVRDYVWE